MTSTFWTPFLGWMAAGGGALAMAFAAPTEDTMLGRMPQIAAHRLDQRPLALPQGLPAERTLAIIVFGRGQHGEVQSWVEGMQLRQDPAISWIKIPVLDDKRDEQGRRDIVQGLLARHASQSDRALLVPVFTDRDGFIRAAKLSGIEHASVLVLDRSGTVLAKAEGHFDEAKGQALRATLLAQGERSPF
ncbi:MAG: hypothetical protein V4864_01690 [Pseudomonadota bacterium]